MSIMPFAHATTTTTTRGRIQRYATYQLWICTMIILCCIIPNEHCALSLISPDRPPFQLKHLDHIVLTFQGDVQPMLEFYRDILGCTIDSPEDIGRMNGKLTHLRAGPTTMIDLMKRDDDQVDPTASSSASRSVDHFCLRIDPFDPNELEEYLQSKGIEIQSSGMRKGAEGVGPSIYIQDPEGNTIELKGPAVELTNDTPKKEVAVYSIKMNEESPKVSKQEPPSASASSQVVEESKMSEVPLTPCTRICRYNADFFGGQVCIGCYREAFEIGTWASMSPSEKHMGLLDAMDRCNDSSDKTLDGAISLEELQRQADYWKKLSLKGN